MKRVQTIGCRATAAMAMFLASGAQAQWTVNVNSDIPAAINQAQTMAQWAKQYEQMVQSITHLKSQVDAMTGPRGLGEILNNPALRAYLPDQWAPIYDQVKYGNLKGLSGKVAAIYSAEGFDPNATAGRRRQLNVLAANKAMTMQAYDATLARVNNINDLMKQANATGDMKATADLQNRMAAENAMIQAEQNRLNLALELQRIEAQLATEQRNREFDSVFTKR
ncbi:P-type DNA transfer protein VirB5 [Massilia sp. LXY-6]|uniref:P-type DNA transfer protein VirB5 n=1 Tax=Massilia sp. LXY-6 TaxID=3379823 RepID=UPI003EDEE7A4